MFSLEDRQYFFIFSRVTLNSNNENNYSMPLNDSNGMLCQLTNRAVARTLRQEMLKHSRDFYKDNKEPKIKAKNKELKKKTPSNEVYIPQ